jgi:hypothetical protein
LVDPQHDPAVVDENQIGSTVSVDVTDQNLARVVLYFYAKVIAIKLLHRLKRDVRQFIRFLWNSTCRLFM